MVHARLGTSRPHICVVDDDPNVLSALVSLLQQDFEVVVARTGRDALRLVRRDPPDLILLDLQMPELDGFAVCRSLKDDPLTAEIPVAFLTAQTDEESEVRGLGAGADDFIAKPPRGPVVLARVRNLVRMKRQADQLKREALRDGLTSLANRRHFTSTLQSECLRAQRLQRPLSLLMLDVDHFKGFNDHYGHLAGDGALVQVGQILLALAHRAGDLAGRLGGEEFAVLLPNTGAAGAMAVAKRALEAMDEAALPHVASPTAAHLTLSIGVATYQPAQDQTSSRDTNFAALGMDAATLLMARADAALYRAKRQGRRQVCVGEDVDSGGNGV